MERNTAALQYEEIQRKHKLEKFRQATVSYEISSEMCNSVVSEDDKKYWQDKKEDSYHAMNHWAMIICELPAAKPSSLSP